MKKILLPLLVMAATSAFSSQANANSTATELLANVKGIYCDYRGSQTYYNLESRKFTSSGRTRDEVTPILDAKADDAKNIIIIKLEKYGRISDDTFLIKGKPFNSGIDIRVILETTNATCVGYL